MATHPLAEPVLTEEQARAQILRYRLAVENSPDLRNRITFTRSWYALRVGSEWSFAPSKFLRRQFENAQDYLATKGHPKSEPDGNRTEKMLAKWFTVVPTHSSLETELGQALDDFLMSFGKRRREEDRISVSRDELEKFDSVDTAKAATELRERIVFDPNICHGRPIVRGTRMRVSDVLDLLAHGASREEIVEDYPYLSNEDVSAVLLYASEAVAHRVLRAA